MIAISGCARTEAAPMYWVDGMRVEQAGSGGAPVILLPGSMSGPWEWATTITELRRHHRTVYAVAFPGFDGAPAPSDSHDLIGRYTDEVVQLISTRHLAKPIVLGHSIGGTIALRIAAEHPDLISGVVAVEGLPVFPGYENESVQQRTDEADAMVALMRAGMTPDAKLTYARNYMRYMGVIDPTAAETYAPMLARSDFTTAAEYYSEDVITDSRVEMAGATVPIWEICPYYQPRDGKIVGTAARRFQRNRHRHCHRIVRHHGGPG
ncbi:alpha/beta fold hydrolase [Nocardia sp. NPDC004722]